MTLALAIVTFLSPAIPRAAPVGWASFQPLAMSNRRRPETSAPLFSVSSPSASALAGLVVCVGDVTVQRHRHVREDLAHRWTSFVSLYRPAVGRELIDHAAWATPGRRLPSLSNLAAAGPLNREKEATPVRRLLIITGALAMLAVPATTAVAKPSKADKREAQRECRDERGTTDATREAFNAKYRNFGDCVSQKAREAKAERKEAKTNAARDCRDERGDTEESREAFRAKYGTNANGRNAFGKCVSEKAKAERAEQDEEDSEEAEDRKDAAEECDAERGETQETRKAFEEKYGTNGNKRNAFGKCVSQKAREA
jgi:hypothetical protein